MSRLGVVHMNFPVVSIITATLNSAKTLEETIQSVRKQTYPHIEYLIIDGGSTDGTFDIIEKYRSSLAHVISEPDDGIYDAYNKGIVASSGDIIYFLNSDDQLADSGVLEHMVRCFLDWPEVWAVYGNIRFREGNKEIVAGQSLTMDDIRQGRIPFHPTLFVRRKVFEALGPFDPCFRVAGDVDFMVRLFVKAGDRIRYENRLVADYGTRGISTRYDTRLTGMREAEAVLRRYFGEAPDLTGAEIRNNALYRMWLENLLVHDRGITSVLKTFNLQRVAVFGTRMTARYLIADLRKEGLQPVCFLDNNPHVQGREIDGVPVFPPNWLNVHPDAADVIIVSVENERDGELIGRLKENIQGDLPIWSWKWLAVEAFRSIDDQ